jgi:hypothetical protein
MYSSWCQAIPLALEEHLRANPEQTAAILTSLQQSNVWTGLSVEQRGDVTAFIAQGFLRAGQLDQAKAMQAEAVRDGGPAAWTEAGFLELESGARDRAAALFARALSKRPDDRGLQRVLELIRNEQQVAKPN